MINKENYRKDLSFGREFLNLPYRTSLNSNIAYKINLYKHDMPLDYDLYDKAHIGFVITDCSKSINLDFDIDSKQEMANSLHKLRTIIGTCEKMIEDIKEARVYVLEGQKKLKELKNQKS